MALKAVDTGTNDISGLSTPDGLKSGLASGYLSPDIGTEKPTVTPDSDIRPASFIEDTQHQDLLSAHWNSPSINKWRILSGCVQYMGMGLFDAAQGEMIPHYETFYHVSYAVVSTTFICNAVGVILAAFLTDFCIRNLGRAKTLFLSEVCMITGVVIGALAPPFGVLLLAFFLIGVGCGMALGVQNIFCANLVEASVVLGIVHGMYSVGGTFAPILATTMVNAGLPWQRYYLIGIGVHVLATVLVVISYRGYEREPANVLRAALEKAAQEAADASGVCDDSPKQEEKKEEKDEEKEVIPNPTEPTPNTDAVDLEKAESIQNTKPTKRVIHKSPFKEAIVLPCTMLGAAFIFAYQAAEVAVSAWIISFLITTRDGDPNKIGYITAGFWGGVTLGRFFLTYFLQPLGVIKAVYMLTTLALIFQVMCWVIPSWISVAVNVSVVGLLIGPIYPFATTRFVGVIDRRLQTVAIGFIASAGSSGGALGPFLIGALASWKGVWVMHPVVISFFGIMLICWFVIPSPPKMDEPAKGGSAEEVKDSSVDKPKSWISRMGELNFLRRVTCFGRSTT